MKKFCVIFLVLSLAITNMVPAKASETEKSSLFNEMLYSQLKEEKEREAKKPSLFAEIDRQFEKDKEREARLADFPSMLEFLAVLEDDKTWTQKDRDIYYARRAVDDFCSLGWHSSIFALMPPAYISAFLKISGWVTVSPEGKVIIRDNSKIAPGPIPLFDINMRFEERGLTPLMIAAQHNRFPDVISLLLEAGANANARDANGIPVLIKALYNENPEVLRRLLSTGPGLNVQVNVLDSASPLIIVAMGIKEDKAAPQKIALLLDAGADPKHKDSRGRRAIDYAKENPYLKDTPEYWRLHDASF